MKNQIIRNIIFNILNFLSNIIITITITPFLIKYLGLDVYGIIPLAIFFTFYISVITQALTSAINRYFTIATQKGNLEESNEIFNTSLCIISSYIVIQLLLLYYPITKIDGIISVPSGNEDSAKILFFCILLGFSLSLVSSIFSVTLYSKNRIDIILLITIVKNILRFILIIAFFKLGYINIYIFGISFIIAELLALIYYITIYKNYAAFLHISIKYFRKNKVKELLSFSSWLFIDQIGYLIFVKSDLLLVNKLQGSSANAEYAIASQFSDLLRSLAGLIGGVLGPVIMILYSKNKMDEIKLIAHFFMKLISYLISIPIILICTFTSEILEIWLGSGFEELKYLIWLITLPLIINLSVIPLLSINVAFNKVKIPSLLNFILGTVGCIISLFIFYNTSLGMYSIAIGLGLALTIKNSIFIPIYASYIMNLPKLTFFNVHLNTLFFSLIYFTFVFIVKNLYIPNGFLILGYMSLLGVVGLFLSVILLPKKQRNTIISYMVNNRKSTMHEK